MLCNGSQDVWILEEKQEFKGVLRLFLRLMYYDIIRYGFCASAQMCIKRELNELTILKLYIFMSTVL